MKKNLVMALVGMLTVATLLVGCGNTGVDKKSDDEFTETMDAVEETESNADEAETEEVEEVEEVEASDEMTLEDYMTEPETWAEIQEGIDQLKVTYADYYADIWMEVEGNHVTYCYQLLEGYVWGETKS